MHNFVIGSLDHSRFGFEVACWHLKKAFFEGSRSSSNQEVFWEVWNQVFAFKWICNMIGVTWDTLSCLVAELWLTREVLKPELMPLDAKKFFESKTVPMRLQKVVKMEPIFRWLGVSFLKKWNFYIFLH